MKRVGSISVLGVKVNAVIASVSEVGDERLLSDVVNATYQQETQTIRLNEDSVKGTPTSARHYTFHECGHAWMTVSGARHYLRGLLRMTPEQFDDVEDTLINMLAPAIDSSHEDLTKIIAALPKACK